jgi:hypothetical protein
MEYTHVSMAFYISEISRKDATIYNLEGMVKELADAAVNHWNCNGDYIPEWISTIFACPIDDPVKLHEVIKAALSFREADKLEVEDDNPTPNLS